MKVNLGQKQDLSIEQNDYHHRIKTRIKSVLTIYGKMGEKAIQLTFL